MKNATGNFEGRDLRNLFYQYWLPEGEIKAYIIGIHGWGTHSDRLKHPAEYLTEKGYAIYAFDLRGHWRSTEEYPGHFEDMDHLQKDIVLFTDVVKKDAKDKKVFLMGHDFGGLVCLMYAINRPDLPGVMVSSPLLGLLIKLSTAKKLAKSLSKFAPTKTIDMPYNQNQLSSDLKILREHIKDKNKTEVISIKSAHEMTNSMKWVIENASKLFSPVLIMQAGNDKIADKAKTKEFFKNIKSEDKTYREYDGYLHELWNERGRAQVYQDMFVWLEKHL